MIGAGIYMWRSQRGDALAETAAQDPPREVEADSLALIQAIADLDNAAEAGEISPAEHQKRRAALKQELKELLARDDD